MPPRALLWAGPALAAAVLYAMRLHRRWRQAQTQQAEAINTALALYHEAVSGTDSAGGQGPAGRLPLLLEAWAVLHDAARLGYGTAALLPANVLYPALSRKWLAPHRYAVAMELGVHFGRLADATNAVRFYEAAQAQAALLRDGARTAAAWGNLGNVHCNVTGDFAAAGHCYRAALAVYRKDPDLRQAMLVTANLGLALLMQKDYPTARATLQQGLDLARRLGDAAGESTLHSLLADVDLAERRADAALQGYRRAHDAAVRAGDAATCAAAHASLGNAYWTLAARRGEGDSPAQDSRRLLAEATAHYKEAVGRLHALGDWPALARLATHLGHALLARGQPDTAAPYLLLATRHLGGSGRTALHSRQRVLNAPLFAAASRGLEYCLVQAGAGAGVGPGLDYDSGSDDTAFSSSRPSECDSSDSERDTGGPAGLPTPPLAFRHVAALGVADDRRAAALGHNLAARLRLSPRLPPWAFGSPPLVALQSAADRWGCTFVLYSLLPFERGAHAWVVAGGQLECRPLPALARMLTWTSADTSPYPGPVAFLPAIAQTLAAPADAGPFLGLLRELRAALIGPLQDALPAPSAGDRPDAAQLVVVPEGPLAAVPFAALHRNARFLCEEYALAVAPSLRLFCLAAATHGQPGPADSAVPPVPRWPPSGDAGGRPMVISPAAPHGPEALVIASLTAAEVVDEEAALPEGVAGAAVLHLHGCNWAASVGPVSPPAPGAASLPAPWESLVERTPLRTSLVTLCGSPSAAPSPAMGRPWQVRRSSTAHLPLPRCSLPPSAAAAVSGLTCAAHLLLSAGAARAVTHLWPSEQAAGQLVQLYRTLRAAGTASAPLSHAQAVRQVLCQAVRSGADPATWAGLVLYGLP